ncbi:MAG: T9SS type A sorting domain-containing protein [Bacteroidetes bacterium]|nr:T9SS type A sorting domain-containing protein [Bacteroidota bacterium]
MNDIPFDARSMTFLDPRHGWIYAQTTDRHTFSIFRYVPAGTSDVHTDATVATPDLRAYPNPSSGDVKLTFTLPQAAPVRAEVYDVLGEKVSTLADGEVLGSGGHHLEWHPKNAAAGVYHVVLRAGNTNAVLRVDYIK